MSKRTYGILAGVIGSAVGAWWWSRQQSAISDGADSSEKGTVIFDNTPTPSAFADEVV